MGRVGHRVEAPPVGIVAGSAAGTGSVAVRSASSSVRRTSAKSSRKSGELRDFSPPPCRIAAGWNVGITVRPCHSCTCPRSRVMPVVVLQHELRGEVAERHDHARLDQRDLLDEPRRAGLDLVGLRDRGSRAAGTSRCSRCRPRSRSSPISPSIRFSSWPAAPTNGSPCLSSWNPGPSPMNIRSASRVADAEDHLGAALRQPALRARRRLGRDLGERAAHDAASPRFAGFACRRRPLAGDAPTPDEQRPGERTDLAVRARAGAPASPCGPAPSSTTSRAVGERAASSTPRRAA